MDWNHLFSLGRKNLEDEKTQSKNIPKFQSNKEKSVLIVIVNLLVIWAEVWEEVWILILKMLQTIYHKGKTISTGIEQKPLS